MDYLCIAPHAGCLDQLYDLKRRTGVDFKLLMEDICHQIATNALVRAQINASSGPGGASTVVCGALHDQSIIVSYNGSGVVDQVVTKIPKFKYR